MNLLVSQLLPWAAAYLDSVVSHSQSYATFVAEFGCCLITQSRDRGWLDIFMHYDRAETRLLITMPKIIPW